MSLASMAPSDVESVPGYRNAFDDIFAGESSGSSLAALRELNRWSQAKPSSFLRARPRTENPRPRKVLVAAFTGSPYDGRLSKRVNVLWGAEPLIKGLEWVKGSYGHSQHQLLSVGV